MAKVKVVGDAVVVISNMKLEDLKTIKKYRPEALTLMGGEEKKTPIFKIGLGSSISPISDMGITFAGETHDEEALATLTGIVVSDAETIDDYKNEIAEHYGKAVMRLTELEATLPAVLKEIEAEKEKALECIEIA